MKALSLAKARAVPVRDTENRTEESAGGVAPFPAVQLLRGQAPLASAEHVEGLLVEDVNLLHASGGSGKTIIALLIAICVACGRTVFGKLEVYRGGSVVLVLPEDGQASARMMLDALMEGLELTKFERELVVESLYLVPDDLRINLLSDTARLGATVQDREAVLLIIDPIAQMIGEESDSENWVGDAVCAALRRDVCRPARASVLLLHHSRKPGKDSFGDEPSKHDARGGGAWVNGARLVYSLTKKDTRLSLVCTKSNRLQTGIRHEVDLEIQAEAGNKAQWKVCRLTDANAGAQSDLLTPGIGRPLNVNEKTALDALSDEHEPNVQLSWSRWSEVSGLNKNTFKSVKTRLLDAGLAEAIPTGRKHSNGSGSTYNYAITDIGRKALDTGWISDRVKGERVSNGE